MPAIAVDSVHAASLSIGSGPSSGATFLANALEGIKARIADAKRRGVAPKRELVIFDIDNTLVDSRYRTLEAMHRFGKANRIPELEHLQLGDVRIDGAATVEALKLQRPGLAAAAQTFWRDFFWRPKSFDLDQPMQGTLRWAHEAARAGAEVIFLTGRIDKHTSISQLKRIGAPFADAAHVKTKPDGVNTAVFKRTTLQQLSASANIGWFMSDSSQELAVARPLAGVPCVRVAFPIAPDACTIDPRIPVLT